MKINDKILCLPPYISTTWNHISTIHLKEDLLVITLTNGETINIPSPTKDVTDSIFHHHMVYLETEELSVVIQDHQMDNFNRSGIHSEASLQLAFNSQDGINTFIQHNPEHANAPELPSEILEKIGAIAKILGADNIISSSNPEPDCNCFHCQITRAFTMGNTPQLTPEQEPVRDEELQFLEWEINQIGEKLFSVTNRLDAQEKYNVYLGSPIGCTCGQQGCPHMLAVLKS